MRQPLIAWLNGYSWHQLLTIAQTWTAPVSVLGHSWPTFSLFLPVQSSLFTLLWAEFFVSSSVQNAQGGVNNFRVTLVRMVHIVLSVRLGLKKSLSSYSTQHAPVAEQRSTNPTVTIIFFTFRELCSHSGSQIYTPDINRSTIKCTKDIYLHCAVTIASGSIDPDIWQRIDSNVMPRDGWHTSQ